MLLHICSTNLLKTLWEKEKLLVTMNFSFSQTVFSIYLEIFLPSSSNSKLLSANSFSLEESKNLSFGKGSRVKTVACCFLDFEWKHFDFRLMRVIVGFFPLGYMYIYCFPKCQILDCSKLKEFAGDRFKFLRNGRKFSEKVEKHCGKGEIARYVQFLLFLQFFSKDLYYRHKKQCLFGKGLNEAFP